MGGINRLSEGSHEARELYLHFKQGVGEEERSEDHVVLTGRDTQILLETEKTGITNC